MKKFEFRLEPLLRYREHCEQQALQALSQARQDVQACEEKIAEYVDTLTRSEEELDRLSMTGIDMETYRIYMDYLNGMEHDMAFEQKRLEKLQNIAMDKQKALARRSIEKKTLENFKDRQKEQYLHEWREWEHKSADDMTLLREARTLKK